MTQLDNLKARLRPGRAYRRADLARWSNSVDRHLRELVHNGVLVKVRRGLYECPRASRFGQMGASPEALVRTFLRDDDYLLTDPNRYNALGVGTTQLYNYWVVYNRKRHGSFELGGQVFEFRRPTHAFPKKSTPEFLLVNLVNELDQLAEDREAVLMRVKEKARDLNSKRLRSAVKRFSKASTKKFFEDTLAHAF